jgi:Spy/CpxP family protein refolding chaperone
MKKRIAIVGSILVVAALAAVPFVYAEPGFRGHMRGHAGGAGLGFFGGRHLDRLAEKLNLSEQQVDQIKAIYAALHDQNAEYRQSMRGGMMDVTETLLKNPNDVAAAQAIIDQQAAAEKAMKTNLLQATAKALNVLTPDQRAELSKMVEERAARFEKHRQ